MYSNNCRKAGYINIMYSNPDDEALHEKFLNCPLYSISNNCKDLDRVECERSILEAYSRASDIGQYNMVDHMLGLYNKVYVKPNVSDTAKIVFTIIQEEIDNLQNMIDNINEALKEGKKEDSKVQLKSDLLYKQNHIKV